MTIYRDDEVMIRRLCERCGQTGRVSCEVAQCTLHACPGQHECSCTRMGDGWYVTIWINLTTAVRRITL